MITHKWLKRLNFFASIYSLEDQQIGQQQKRPPNEAYHTLDLQWFIGKLISDEFPHERDGRGFFLSDFALDHPQVGILDSRQQSLLRDLIHHPRPFAISCTRVIGVFIPIQFEDESKFVTRSGLGILTACGHYQLNKIRHHLPDRPDKRLKPALSRVGFVSQYTINGYIG